MSFVITNDLTTTDLYKRRRQIPDKRSVGSDRPVSCLLTSPAPLHNPIFSNVVAAAVFLLTSAVAAVLAAVSHCCYRD